MNSCIEVNCSYRITFANQIYGITLRGCFCKKSEEIPLVNVMGIFTILTSMLKLCFIKISF
jgi:hypothetical protein